MAGLMSATQQLLRVVATAGPFRRGGHRFGPEPVLLGPGDVAEPEQLLAILQEERLDVQFSEDGGESFSPLSAEDVTSLVEAVATLRGAGRFEASKVDPEKVEALSGGATVKAEEITSEKPSADADSSPADGVTAAAAVAVVSAGGEAAGEASPGVKEEPVADPVPAPVAATRSSKPSGRRGKPTQG